MTASHKIQDYVSVTYPALGLNLSEIKYNFKNSAYGCYAQSPKSEDTKFYIGYSHGKIIDEYEYEVANHFTTYRRLSKDFNNVVTNIIAEEYPHKTTLISGGLIGDTQKLTPDVPLDLKNMPLKLSLTISILSDIRNEEQMAALLIELHHLMLNKNIPIDQYTIRLEEPIPSDRKPGSGDNLYLEDFPANNIVDNRGDLISAIKKHQAAITEQEKK